MKDSSTMRFVNFVIAFSSIFLSSLLPVFANENGALDLVSAGSIPGSFEVDSEGAAHYSIPIEVPPGTLGMSPAIQLTYNSHSPYGIMGVGWTLSGFSSISRCSIRRYEGDPPDSTLKYFPVEYPTIENGKLDSDRFCLDGQYLKARRGQAYGADGTVYHPETSPWTKVQSFGTCGSGPCYFVVIRKDGLTREYGKSADSRIEAVPAKDDSIPENSVRIWAVTTEEDLNGNHMKFGYLKDTGSGEFHPETVLYTANDTPEQSLVYQRAVSFDYTHNGTNSKPHFQGGAKIQNTKLLKSIKTCLSVEEISGCHDVTVNGFQTVFTYELTYEDSTATKRKKLSSITQFEADGSHYKPTRFEYATQRENKFSDAKEWSTEFGWDDGWNHASYQERRMADINGDGRYDLIGFGYSKTHFALSDGDEFVTADPQSMFSKLDGYSDLGKYPRMMADVNADGREDIIGFGYRNIQVALSQGEGFSGPQDWSDYLTYGNGGWDSQNIRTIGDVNGDGRSDIVGFGNSKLVLLVSTGHGFDSPIIYENWFTKKDGYRTPRDFPRMLADVNGDGRADIIGFLKDGNVQVGISTGSGFKAPESWTVEFKGTNDNWIAGRNPRYIQDMNGDGLADLIGFTDDHVIVAFSTGKSFTAPEKWTKDFTYNNGGWNDSAGTMRVLGDVNGDRLPDVIAFGHNNTYFGISVGSKFSSDLYDEIKDTYGYQSIGQNPRFPADVTGNGIVTLVGIGDRRVIVSKPPSHEVDLLTSIVNGMGAKTSLNYVSIASKDGQKHYHVSEDTFSYPDRTFRAPMQVVKDYAFEDGRGNTYHFEYKYDDALLDVLVRGYRGFRKSTMINKQINPRAGPWDAEAGLATEVTMHQKFPLKGIIERKYVYRVEDHLPVSDYTFEYETPEINPGILDPRITKKKSRKYSILNGNYYETVVDFSYDNFGNTSLVKDDRNTETDKDNYSICSVFENDVDAWRLGYLREETTAKACEYNAETGCSCDEVISRNETYYSDDGRWNVEYSRSFDDTDQHWLGKVFEYDDIGHVTKSSGAYWSDQNKSKIPDKTFHVENFSYDPVYKTFVDETANQFFKEKTRFDPRFGEIVENIDANNVAIRHHLDGFGKIREVTGPDPRDGRGNQVTLLKIDEISTEIGLQRKTLHRIDWDGRFSENTSHLDGMGRAYREDTKFDDQCIMRDDIEYFSVKRVSRKSLPFYQSIDGQSCPKSEAASWVRYDYDSIGQVEKVRLADGTINFFQHDIEKFEDVYRDKTTQIDAYDSDDARKIVSFLDDHQSLLHRTFPRLKDGDEAPSVTNRYDRIGRLLISRAPQDVFTKLAYNTLGDVVTTEDNIHGKRSYKFDDRGYEIETTDDLNQKINYEYDEIGRLVQQASKDLNGDETEHRFIYGQDDHGYSKARLSHVVDVPRNITHDYHYDAYGNTSVSRLQIDGRQFEASGHYDPLGRETVSVYPDGSIQEQAFDIAGFLKNTKLCRKDLGHDCSARENFEIYAAYDDYTALGKPQMASYRDGRVSKGSYSYDVLGRVNTYKLALGDIPDAVLDQKYQWNALNLIKKIEDLQNPDKTRVFDFYENYSLKSATVGSRTRHFDYNIIGDIVQKGDLHISYPDKRRVTASHNGEVVSTSKYNALGNLTERSVSNPDEQTKTGWRLEYDAFNNVTTATRSVEHDGTTVTYGDLYVYDYQGNILKRTTGDVTSYYAFPSYDIAVPETGAIVETKYVFGHTQPIAAISSSRDREIASPSDAGNTIASEQGGLHPGTNGSGIPTAGDTLFFHYDLANSNTIITDDIGNITARISYSPYGEILEQESSGTNNFRAKFDSYELFDELELYNTGPRYYDPLIGRFTSPDSHMVGGPDTHIASYNRYAFAANNPITYVDPTGHSWLSILSYVKFAIDVVTMNVPMIVADAGAYMGASAVNHTNNPEKWDAKSAKTYLGMAAGIAISETAAAISIVAPEAIPEEAGFFASFMAGVAADATAGFIENAGYAALGGSSAEESARQGLMGAAIAGGMSAGFRGIGRVASKAFKGAGKAASEVCSSFLAGTLISTKEGTKLIELIEVGDEVWSYNESTGKTELKVVSQLFKRVATGLVALTLGTSTVEATPEHPFYLPEENEWRDAGDLSIGDQVFSQSGQTVTVTASETRQGETVVYNFEVQGNHNYFAGQANVLVHNPGFCSGDPAGSARSYRSSNRMGPEAPGSANIGIASDYAQYGPSAVTSTSTRVSVRSTSGLTNKGHGELLSLGDITPGGFNPESPIAGPGVRSGSGYRRIEIYTEKPPCEGCQWQFRRYTYKHPDAVLSVYYRSNVYHGTYYEGGRFMDPSGRVTSPPRPIN